MTTKHLYSFGSYRLDGDERVLLRDGLPVTLPPKDLETLLVLVERAGHIVEKEELLEKVWSGVFVEEGNLSRRIFNLRQVLGDTEDGRKYIQTIPRRGYRFIAPIKKLGPTVIPQGASAQPTGQPPRQEIRFCVAEDGARLAWASVGSGFPLVKAANWLNHLDFEWESPVWKHWIAQLTRHHRFIRYDERGNGLSDWEVTDVSLELWVRDLETVVDAAGVDRFALLGISQGGPVAISYAVRHPERVSHLILLGTYSRGLHHRVVPPEELEGRRALETLVRLNWGKNHADFSQMFARRFIADDAACEARKWLDDLQRVTTLPGNAALVMETCDKINVRNLLPSVSVPTIVFHCDNDRVTPAEEGRIVAAEIPNARFVPLPGANHILMEGEPAWQILVQELGTFLGWQGVMPDRLEKIS